MRLWQVLAASVGLCVLIAFTLTNDHPIPESPSYTAGHSSLTDPAPRVQRHWDARAIPDTLRTEAGGADFRVGGRSPSEPHSTGELAPEPSEVRAPAANASMPFQQPADIANWLRVLRGRYVILRNRKDFPMYKLGDDLDVLTELEPTDAIRQWTSESYQQQMLLPGWKLKADAYKCHLHVDLLRRWDGKDRIGYRFDLISSLPKCVRALKIHPRYSEDVLRRAEITVRHGDVYWVPSSSDDRVLRYLEYLDHPEKKRHLDAIQQLPQVPFTQPVAKQQEPYLNVACPAKYEPQVTSP